MPELIESSLPIQAGTLVLTLLLCLVPHLARRGRTVVAVLLALPALGLLVDVVALDHSGTNVVEVVNVFGRAPEGEPHIWVTDTVEAAAWAWHVAAAILLASAAIVVLALRGRPTGTPRPVLFGAVIFAFFTAGRLALEATGAHQPIAWGFSANTALLVVLPFFGFWCARRGTRPGSYVAKLALLGLAQRIPLIAAGWVATTYELGTHLDTGVITDVMIPGLGNFELATPTERWFYPTLIPQLTVWVVMTVLFGAVLSILPYWLASRGDRTSDQKKV